MTNEEKMMRRTGITAVEAVGLAGLSPLTPREVYELKLKPKRPAATSDRRVVMAEYKFSDQLVELEPRMFRNPVQRFAICEPSWRGRPNPSSPVPWPSDIKWLVLPVQLYSPRLGREWGANKVGSTKVPPAIYAEAQWMMGATGYSHLDVVVMYEPPYNRIQTRHVKFHAATFARLYGIAEFFMAENVLQRIPPK